MADDEKIGREWQEDELDAIVADYFDMLADELSSRPYVKVRHSRDLMARIGRTHRSVEFKHQNISAVLDKLGLPWIPGYIPKRNYQGAILDAIDRYLTRHPGILEAFPASPSAAALAAPEVPEIFVPPPVLTPPGAPLPEPLQHLVRKFDPVERDHHNRALGKAGEEFVLQLERRQLIDAGRNDLAASVRWVADDDGDGAGYDVLSFDNQGHQRLLEVKTTNGSARTPFFLTRNELALAAEQPTDWHIYRVHLFATERRIFTISPPLEGVVHLIADTWRASF